MYKNEFKELVSSSYIKSKIYYNNSYPILNDELKPNPYYVGFGNPNSEILLLGKEKAFNEEDEEKLKYESILNPVEWLAYIKNSILYNKEKFYDESKNYLNAFFPYRGENSKGGTWFTYEKLINKIYGENRISHNDFFQKAFLSEVNPYPSKTSKIKKFKDPERIQFLSNDFYKSFKVIFLACGDYLMSRDIEKIFNVEFVEDYSKPRHKLRIYKNKYSIVINTRQLSNSMKDVYIDKLAEIVKVHLKTSNI